MWSRERLEEAIRNNEVEFNKQKDGTYSVRAKKYLYDEYGNIRRGKPLSIYNGPFTQDGTSEIREVFGTEDAFKFAKPSELIRKFVAFEVNGKSSKNAIVLDFFAGSGTTAQAVLEQNYRDGGNRTFILCTNNENGICENVTYKRIESIINNKYQRNFKYYKTDFVDKTSDDEDYSVSAELLRHIGEMVQLEYAVKLDGSNYVLLLSDDEADTFIADTDKLSNCKAVYISSAVLLTAEQNKTLANRGVAVYVIPDYYFESELLEVGER